MERTLVLLAGLAHFGLVAVGSQVPRVFRFRDILAPLGAAPRRLIWTWGIFIVLANLGFGTLSLAYADEIAAGKGLAGGYAPIAGVYATSHIAEAIASAGMNVMFHTFGAHPASCAAAEEVLRILTDEQLVERSARIGERLQQRLLQTFSNHPHVAEVRGRGLLQAIEIVADRGTLEPFPLEANVTDRVVGAALSRDVFFYPGGTGVVRDIVCLGPPFTIDEREIERMVEVLEASVNDVVRRVAA